MMFDRNDFILWHGVCKVIGETGLNPLDISKLSEVLSMRHVLRSIGMVILFVGLLFFVLITIGNFISGTSSDQWPVNARILVSMVCVVLGCLFGGVTAMYLDTE